MFKKAEIFFKPIIVKNSISAYYLIGFRGFLPDKPLVVVLIAEST